MPTDYLPPIQRAIRALPSNTPEARKVLYERARAALLKQLTSMDPPLADAQITRERLQLEDAIRRIEDEQPDAARSLEDLREAAENAGEPVAVPDAAPPPAGPPRESAAPTPDLPKPAGKAAARRPPAPRREEPRGNRTVMLAGAAAGVVVAILLAVAAVLFMRDGGGDSAPAPVAAVETPASAVEQEAGGKLTERLGEPTPIAEPQPVPAEEPAPPPTAGTATTPPATEPQPVPAEPAAPAISSEPEPLAPVTPEPAAPAAMAPQRAILLEEDPATPGRGLSFSGTTTWRTESVAAGTGQPVETAILGAIDIPERKLTATVSIRRNTDPALPATHTVELRFEVPPDFPNGGIQNVPGLLMKEGEVMRGAPLNGVSVRVTDGFFLIGLSNAPSDEGRNAALLRDRDWIDIPLLFDNGRKAILTVEKGATGTKAFADAFADWGG